MELKQFVEKALTDIAEGMTAANKKFPGYSIQPGNKVTFSIAVMDTSIPGGIEVVNPNLKSPSDSKQYNFISFEAVFYPRMGFESPDPNQ